MRHKEADWHFWRMWPGNWWDEDYNPACEWKLWCMVGEL